MDSLCGRKPSQLKRGAVVARGAQAVAQAQVSTTQLTRDLVHVQVRRGAQQHGVGSGQSSRTLSRRRGSPRPHLPYFVIRLLVVSPRHSDGASFTPRRVVENLHVHALSRQLHVADNAAADEAVAHAFHMRKALLVHHTCVLQLDVQVLQ